MHGKIVKLALVIFNIAVVVLLVILSYQIILCDGPSDLGRAAAFIPSFRLVLIYIVGAVGVAWIVGNVILVFLFRAAAKTECNT
ncbi:hypothetical protein [Pseudomonas fluorescens]|uniref:hypothetical protein n=1 Tax=Pseudomonas fluorescens TaxID=294 RepID=UPI0012420C8C|nr:hypothetical protein [Pseudomonas fluorescens]